MRIKRKKYKWFQRTENSFSLLGDIHFFKVNSILLILIVFCMNVNGARMPQFRIWYSHESCRARLKTFQKFSRRDANLTLPIRFQIQDLKSRDVIAFSGCKIKWHKTCPGQYQKITQSTFGSEFNGRRQSDPRSVVYQANFYEIFSPKFRSHLGPKFRPSNN